MALDLRDAADNLEDISTKVKSQLAGSPFEVLSLRFISGGGANFNFHGLLKEPLEDGTMDVFVKHGEGYVATNPNFPIPTSRCQTEEMVLRHLSNLEPSASPRWVVKTPRLLYFDQATNNQIQEFQPGATSLKDYGRTRYAAPTPASLESQCNELGRDLGLWLRSFHEWSNHKNQAKLREIVSQVSFGRDAKHMINYQALLEMVKRFPAALGHCEKVFEEIRDATAAEVLDESSLSVIHGDFWTGNILMPDRPIDDGSQTPVYVVDWEMAQLNLLPLDIGQMVAELYELKLFDDIDAGLWIIRGFSAGYGAVDDDFAYRALVHVGAHLVCIAPVAPGWGPPERVEKVVAVGRDVLLAAWKKDRAFFKAHDLGCLFSTPS